jgi:SPP1 family predicted phage head-tail adaptor
MLPPRISSNVSYTPLGAMNSKITLLNPTNRRDGNGDPVDPDVFASGVWAKIQALAQRYTDKPDQTTIRATAKIVIRYQPGITSAMLVKDEATGAIYNMMTANDPDGHRVELWLMCYISTDGKT